MAGRRRTQVRRRPLLSGGPDRRISVRAAEPGRSSLRFVQAGTCGRGSRSGVIVYLGSSVLARAYLGDEEGHQESVSLLANPETALITGAWSRIEVSGALVRAARAGRGDEDGLLALLDADLAADGPVTVVTADQGKVESRALRLVREHAIRAMDAWHLAVAALTLPSLAEPGEEQGFATREGIRADGKRRCFRPVHSDVSASAASAVTGRRPSARDRRCRRLSRAEGRAVHR